MDKLDFFKSRQGRVIYNELTKAIQEGATVQDLSDLLQDALKRAYNAMGEAKIRN